MKNCEKRVRDELLSATKAKANIEAKLKKVKQELSEYTEQFPQTLIYEGNTLSWQLEEVIDQIDFLNNELTEIEGDE